MKIVGVIRRRLLVNYRVAPEAVAPLLPAPLRPKLASDWAVGGVCLIRLERIRPRGLPPWVGFSSENAAHRIAVEWHENGARREGVYIPRRDSSSWVNRLAGGRLFPGEHHLARFDVSDDGDRVALAMRSDDGDLEVEVRGRAATNLPAGSVFSSLEAASAFFEGGAIGYSATAAGRHLDGIELVTRGWRVEPLAIEQVRSSYFERLPAGSAVFDCALVMRDVVHEWSPVGRMRIGGSS